MNPAITSTSDIKALPFVSLQNRKQLPVASGVYFVCDGSKNVCYIGISKNLNARWLTHHRMKVFEGLPECQIHYLVVADTDSLLSIEAALIKRFVPALNIAGTSCLNSPKQRQYIGYLGEFCDDALSVEAALNGRPKSAEAVHLLRQGLDENAEIRNQMVQYLADKRGIGFGEMWQQLISETCKKQG